MRATTQTRPLRQFLKEMPDLAAVLIERYGVEPTRIGDLHVLVVENAPALDSGRDAEAGRSERVVTTAVIVDRPIKVRVYAVGVSVKSPYDIHDRSIGRAIAISRAVRRAARKLWQ